MALAVTLSIDSRRKATSGLLASVYIDAKHLEIKCTF